MPVSLEVSSGLTPYPQALARMEAWAEAIREGTAREGLWFVEHPPLYTAGTSARVEDLLEPARFPVYDAGRGGQYTYHGPGQRVVYAMLDLKARGSDVRAYVAGLEDWLIDTLALLGVTGERRSDRVGVWVRRGGAGSRGAEGEDKIAAIGVRIRRWVAFHGISLNVAPDLAHFDGIVPCGVHQHGVTSLAALGHPANMARVDEALLATFSQIFGPIDPVPA